MNVFSGRNLASERGVSVVIVAVCITMLLGIAAFVVDVSVLHQERRELQNGADAAALAVAWDCAIDPDCGDEYTTADTYVDGNASDLDSNVLPGDITYPAANQVRVRATTADSDGFAGDGDSTTVDFFFAPVFGQEGSPVSAEAIAEWGVPSSAATLPITFSLCEWNEYLAANGGFSQGPPFSGAPWVLEFLTSNAGGSGGGNSGGNSGNTGPGDCAAQAGQDTDGDDRLEGGFGWLDESGCEALIVEGNWVAAKPGNGIPQGCDLSADLLGQTVLIPIFDDVWDNDDGSAPCSGPAGKCYHIYGFAAFYVDGYRFPGEWHNPPCNPPKTCLGGYFTKFVFSNTGGTGGGGGPDLGAKIVYLVG